MQKNKPLVTAAFRGLVFFGVLLSDDNAWYIVHGNEALMYTYGRNSYVLSRQPILKRYATNNQSKRINPRMSATPI